MEIVRVQELRQQQYTEHNRFLTYNTNRGLYGTQNFSYEVDLPRWNSQTVSQVIETKVSGLGRTVDIADFGCGKGLFLSDCKRQWGEQVSCTGLNSFPYQGMDAITSGVQFVTGDVQSASQVVGKDKFDLATSHRVFEYLADPWGALGEMYSTLRMGGVGFIGYFPLFSTYIGEKNLLDTYKARLTLLGNLWNEYGIIGVRNQHDPRYYQLSFAKNKEELVLPLSHEGKEKIFTPQGGRNYYDVIRYQLNPDILE